MSIVHLFFGTAVFILARAFTALAYARKLALVITNQAYPATTSRSRKYTPRWSAHGGGAEGARLYGRS